MGRRGPPPKPSELKKKLGTYRADRAARNELELPVEAPELPSWLDAEAKKEWGRVVPVLIENNVLAKIDGSMLANYCTAHSLAIRAEKRLQKEGLILKTPFGPQKNPLIKIAQEARAQARLLAAEFGLSPASRSRIDLPEKPKEEDKDESFLFGELKAIDGGAGK